MATTLPGRVQRAMRSPMLGSQRGRHLQARRQRVIGRQRRLQRVTRRAAPLPQMVWDCPRLLARSPSLRLPLARSRASPR